ncbi:MAG: adenylate/guanylate cyclase domain-containing protein [Magnetococcales bacterium]|nr:adenylate/guanylate cyclase domain-containing protein [Magnetococcales bacterium]
MSQINPSSPPHTQAIDQPFPLRRLFRHWFIPAVLGFIVLFLFLVGYFSILTVKSIYLEMAQRRAQSIAKGVSLAAPEAWNRLMSGHTRPAADVPSVIPDLADALEREVHEQGLTELKVYGLDRRVLYATHKDEIGTTEAAAALQEVLDHAAPGVVEKTEADGSQVYELYVPVFNGQGAVRTVFELYEPIGYLDTILKRAIIPTIVVPATLLLALILALDRLVNSAQGHIDARTKEARELRRKVESFVSSTAAREAKRAGTAGRILSRRMTTSLFYSDIRDFSGFSEQNSPEAVVDFLNEIMTLQVNIIQRHGGDVDKMIGDAVLARFDGEAGSRQAIAAARSILTVLKTHPLPRTLGIGLYRGEVISGAIGPENRRDFTVIGDAVNVAARLCAAARKDEVVADADMADADFGPAESIQVKGRKQSVTIKRYPPVRED